MHGKMTAAAREKVLAPTGQAWEGGGLSGSYSTGLGARIARVHL